MDACDWLVAQGRNYAPPIEKTEPVLSSRRWGDLASLRLAISWTYFHLTWYTSISSVSHALFHVITTFLRGKMIHMWDLDILLSLFHSPYTPLTRSSFGLSCQSVTWKWLKCNEESKFMSYYWCPIALTILFYIFRTIVLIHKKNHVWILDDLVFVPVHVIWGKSTSGHHYSAVCLSQHTVFTLVITPSNMIIIISHVFLKVYSCVFWIVP